MSPLTDSASTVSVTTATSDAVAMTDAGPSRPAPRTPSAIPSRANHTVGGAPSAETAVNATIPAMAPPMSIAYARSGGKARSNGPSGSDSVARTTATATNSIVSTTRFGSAAWLAISAPRTSSVPGRRSMRATRTSSAMRTRAGP